MFIKVSSNNLLFKHLFYYLKSITNMSTFSKISKTGNLKTKLSVSCCTNWNNLDWQTNAIKRYDYFDYQLLMI